MKKINILLAILVVIIGFVLMALTTDAVQSMQSGFLSMVSPFLKTGSAVQEGIGAVGQGLKTLDQLEAENRELARENQELRATVQILRDLEGENNRLRSALDYRERSLFKLIPAQVIARDSSTWWQTIMINRGFEDGVEAEQTVITDQGLVGKTMTVTKNSAVVLLVTDENCHVGAYVEGTRFKGIVSGLRIQEAGPGLLQMNYLEKNADLKPGQKIYTQGVGAVFQSGLPIGNVVSFQPRDLDGQAIVEPAVDFSTLSDVFVIEKVK